MDNEFLRSLAAPALVGLSQLLSLVDPEEEIPVGGLAAIVRLIADAATVDDRETEN